MTNQTKRSFFLSSVMALSASGCVGAPGGEEVTSPVATTVLGTPAAVGERAVPDVMSCVSSPLEGGWADPQVLRVSIAGTSVAITQGAQFRSRNGTWAEDGAAQTIEMKRSADGARLQQGNVLRHLDITLRRDGAVVRGTLVDDQCYQRVETELTCWNELELFGSPWAQIPGLLGATFDWETGECVDAEGAPALNATPIEVVRETGNGQCADLSGVALNGSDFGGPSLDGWMLLGARLDGAQLAFATLRYAALQGADLSGMQLGYATLDGSIDAFTALPSEVACEVTSSPWTGDSVTCTR